MCLTQERVRYIGDGIKLQDVASNPNTPIDKLIELSQHPSPFVRLRVAKNPSIPFELLETLSQDESVWVREASISNPQITVKILSRFVKYDEDEDIRFLAKKKGGKGRFRMDRVVTGYDSEKQRPIAERQEEGYWGKVK